MSKAENDLSFRDNHKGETIFSTNINDLVKCPICNGYFPKDITKHMNDFHVKAGSHTELLYALAEKKKEFVHTSLSIFCIWRMIHQKVKRQPMSEKEANLFKQLRSEVQIYSKFIFS